MRASVWPHDETTRRGGPPPLRSAGGLPGATQSLVLHPVEPGGAWVCIDQGLRGAVIDSVRSRALVGRGARPGSKGSDGPRASINGLEGKRSRHADGQADGGASTAQNSRCRLPSERPTVCRKRRYGLHPPDLRVVRGGDESARFPSISVTNPRAHRGLVDGLDGGGRAAPSRPFDATHLRAAIFRRAHARSLHREAK